MKKKMMMRSSSRAGISEDGGSSFTWWLRLVLRQVFSPSIASDQEKSFNFICRFCFVHSVVTDSLFVLRCVSACAVATQDDARLRRHTRILPFKSQSSYTAVPDDENLQGFQHRNLEEDNMCSFTCLFCAGASRERKQSLAGSIIIAIRDVGKRACGCWLVHQPKVHAALVQLEVLEMDNAAAHMPMNLDSNNEGLSST